MFLFMKSQSKFKYLYINSFERKGSVTKSNRIKRVDRITIKIVFERECYRTVVKI